MPKILVSPLDWGLGHASRCVPIIHALEKAGAGVLLGGDGMSLELLKKEFPNLPYVTIPGPEITYSESKSLYEHFLPKLPYLAKSLKEEHDLLQEIVESENVHAVVSDNRYGLNSRNVSSVIITHQLHLQIPFFRKSVSKMLRSRVGRFDHCWIPDFVKGSRLAGELSSSEGLPNATYIGPLSRFSNRDFIGDNNILAILSGPEPHRSLFETKLLKMLSKQPGKHSLVRGTKVPIKGVNIPPNVRLYDFSTGMQLEELIDSAQYLISRSGYSSIMDFVVKGRKAILVPTPGQYEQEYLGKLHSDSASFVVQEENNFDLERALIELKAKDREVNQNLDSSNLDMIVQDFCESIY